MNMLYTLAYPTLSNADMLRIEELRHIHNANCEHVQAHFTMVFSCGDVDENDYMEHVKSLSQAAQPISFVCRYAMLGADEAEQAYIFLVPDEGYSGLSRLHDALYRGLLAERLCLEIPYIPHITIGSITDRVAAKRLCDDLNERGLDIQGTVDALTVATLEELKIRNLATFYLGA